MHTADWVTDFGEAHKKYSKIPAENPEKRKEIMSWLEGLTQDDWRQNYSDSEVQETAKAALALLLEQEPVKPNKPGTAYKTTWSCGVCAHPLSPNWVACPSCGKAVKWE